MDFSLWLFASKQLAQTYEMSQVIYQQLPEAEKKVLKKEYNRTVLGKDDEEETTGGRSFKPGDIVKHFKRERNSKDDNARNKYVYQIIGIAENADTGEKLMVYQAMYDDFRLYVRPLKLFMSEVDHQMYPQIKQKYRFELK